MPSYAVVGASKGIGRELVKQLSDDSVNTVFALVRQFTGPIADLANARSNVHLIKADAADAASLLAAANEVSKGTDGKLDVLIYNSNAIDLSTVGLSPSQLPVDDESTTKAFQPSISTGLYGPLWSANSFLPLIEAGNEKKIIFISSGLADVPLTLTSQATFNVPYSMVKAAMNMLTAKYAVELAPKGIKTLAVSPGWVDTWEGPKPDGLLAMVDMQLKVFQRVQPSLKAQTTPLESARDVIKRIESLDTSLSGQFVSQHGNTKDWF